MILAGSGAANALTITEDFNASGFQGSNLNLTPPSEQSSDKYAQTGYYTINNFDGWSFTSGTYYALGSVPGGGTDGAVLLNEDGGTATTIVGLAASTQYQLSFLVYGDNRPPGDTPTGHSQTGIWGLHVDANGVLGDYSGVDQLAGTNPGTTYLLLFTSDASGSASLFFGQTTPSGSEASPIIDNIRISDNIAGSGTETPLPAALPLFAGGLGAIGWLARGRSRKRAQR